MIKSIAKWGVISLSILVFISIVFLLVANINDTDSYDENAGDHDDIKIAAVGDSITYGYGNAFEDMTDNAYPQHLAELLGDGYWVENFGVNNRAAMQSADHPYTDTDEYQKSLEFNPDIALIMLGTNDSKNINWQGREQFKEEYEELVDAYADNNPDTAIHLMTPPKAFNEPGFEGDIDNNNVDEITEVVEEVAEERNFGLIDINALTQGNPQWFDADDIHPDSEGAKSIAEEVHEHLNASDN